MKTINRVASDCITRFKTAFHDDELDLSNTYVAWNALRDFKGLPADRIAFNRVLGNLIEVVHRKYCIEGLKERNFFTETANLRLTVFIMGGVKGNPQWEPDISVGVIDHSLNP